MIRTRLIPLRSFRTRSIRSICNNPVLLQAKESLHNNASTFKFYDEELKSGQPPMKPDDQTVNSLTFETNTLGEKKMSLDDIFGSGGKKQVVSSRMDLSYRADVRDICGVEVPRRPIEPTNCCGSGCVNCVWVIFDDDMEDWKEVTKEAVELLNSQDKSKPDDQLEKWPVNFDPPPKGLDPKFIPQELQQQEKEEVVNSMPVQFSVFTNFERNMKKKKLSHSTDLDTVEASDFKQDQP